MSYNLKSTFFISLVINEVFSVELMWEKETYNKYYFSFTYFLNNFFHWSVLIVKDKEQKKFQKLFETEALIQINFFFNW